MRLKQNVDMLQLYLNRVRLDVVELHMESEELDFFIIKIRPDTIIIYYCNRGTIRVTEKCPGGRIRRLHTSSRLYHKVRITCSHQNKPKSWAACVPDK